MAKEAIFYTEDKDVYEDSILKFDPTILELLLKDKTTKKNILWATNDYEHLGVGYAEADEIKPELITGEKSLLIQPRSAKTKEEQILRTRDKAEVFTPSWICNSQNNYVDSEWFGYQNVFNKEILEGWDTNKEKIRFTVEGKTWKKYVDAQRLEVTCGEAPYLVSRYDTVTGNTIPLNERIGFFDRKMRIVNENTETNEEWIFWSIRALQSVFGYEYQGDNLLLARENLFLSYIDYYRARFHEELETKLLRKVANIVAWNIWQMDGLKYVIPNSCHKESSQDDLFSEGGPEQLCPGCEHNNPYFHNGIYCRIQDWRTKATIRFVDMLKGKR